ncbi:MAG: hypothetical protein R6V58_15965 [Planctomycetota bacterium]
MNQRWSVGLALLCLGVASCAARGPGGDVPLKPARKDPARFTPDLPLNTWVRVEPKYVRPPEGGRHRPAGWNKLVYDPVGERMLYMDRWSTRTRGHSIYANAVMAFDVAANTVTCLKLTNWKRQDTAKGGYRTVPLPANKEEPTPCDRHPYGNLAFVPDRNSLYLSTGANRSALRGNLRGQSVTRDTWRYDCAEAKWVQIDESKTKPPGGLEDAMAYDAAHKVIVRICRGRATWLLDVETDRWRDAKAKDNPGSGMGAAMCYDSKRERVMVFGGGGKHGAAWNTPHPECYAYSVPRNAWIRLADAPVPVRSMGAAYDAKRDVVLVHTGRGRYPYFFGFYDPAKDEWRRLDLPADAKRPVPRWHTLAYDVAHDVYVRASASSGRPEWWLFRPDLSKAAPIEKRPSGKSKEE